MPKSVGLPFRRWPCWPGPYSRRFTGLFGRPKTFSPMRRSSLYLALVRFVIVQSFNCVVVVPGPRCDLLKDSEGQDHRFTGVRGQLRTRELGNGAPNVKLS